MLDNNNDFEELTGPEAIYRALQEVDMDSLRAGAQAELAKKKKSSRKPSIQMLQAIDGVSKSGVKPIDLMIKNVPVIPPLFRPYAITGDTFMAGHSNELYRDLLESKNGYENMKATFGDEASRESGYNLYNATKALYGYGEAVNPKTKARGVTGFMSQILGGSSPKFSVPQRRLFSKTTDSVSRSVITVNPEFDIDQIGLPRHMAMKQYAPHIQRKLVQQGYGNIDAIKHIKDNSKVANKALEELVTTMPVVYSRAPAWHKYNVLAGWVNLTDGDSISINPYVTSGIGGDFDGDSGRFWLCIKKNIDKVENCGYSSPATENIHMSFKNITTAQLVNGLKENVRIQDIPLIPNSGKTIGEGIIEFDVEPGNQALAYNIETGESTWAPITKLSIHQNIEMHPISVGKDSFLASNDHSLLAFSRETNKVEKLAPLSTRAQNKSEKNYHAPVSKKILIESACFTEVEGPTSALIPASYELGFALGVYAGDGAFSVSRKDDTFYVKAMYLYGGGAATSKRKQKTHMDAALTFWSLFKLNSDTPSYAEYDRESINGVLGLSGRTAINSGADQSIMLSGYNWLKGLCGASAESKCFPWFAVDANEDFRWGLFCGMLASDGTVTVSNSKSKPQLIISLSSITSAQLATDFSALCRSLGIGSNISVAKRLTTTGKQEFTVSVSTSDLAVRYQKNKFSIGCEVRDAILAELLPSIRVENTSDPIPFPGGELCQVLRYAFWEHTGKPIKTGNKKNFGASDTWNATGCWHRSVAAKWLPILRPLIDKDWVEAYDEYTSIVLDDSITWAEIFVDDETVTDVAFDITVPGPYTFATSGGTFVQDTVTVHLPAMKESQDEAKDILMPSKMVLSNKKEDTVVPAIKHEQILGLYTAKNKQSMATHNFATREEALTAIKKGSVRLSDEITIGDQKIP